MKTEQVLSRIDQEMSAGRPVSLNREEAKMVLERLSNLEALVGSLLLSVKKANLSVELPAARESA